MFKYLKNWFSGNGFLNDSYIKKIAKIDASDGLILDKDTPSIFEQKLINYYQTQINEYASKNIDELYALLNSHMEQKITSFITNAFYEEQICAKEAQDASNVYRKEHFRILRDEKNPANTIEIDNFLTYKFDISEPISSLLDYKAVMQAKSDAKLISNGLEDFYTLKNTFYKKNIKEVQIAIIENYEQSEKIPSLIQHYEDDKIEKAQLQNKIKELKAKERKLFNKLYNSFYIYRNTILHLLEGKIEENNFEKIKELRQRIRLYYDVPLDLDSVEEYSVIEKAQSDSDEGIELYTTSGSFSPYEYYLRDVYQEKIDNYYEAHGLQYRYMKDEEQIILDTQTTEDVQHNYHNPLIVQSGVSFENRIESRFTKLVNLYRMEYLRLITQEENSQELAAQLAYMPTLKFHFKNIEDETLSVEIIKNAATKDSSILNNDIKTTTTFMYSIAKKYQKLVEKNHKSYERKYAKVQNSADISMIQELLATHLEEESVLNNQYKEFQLIYIREFVNRKQLQSDTKIQINYDDETQTQLIPELTLYFDNLNYNKSIMEDETIIELAKIDASLQTAQKRYPDFTYSERKIRNEFMYFYHTMKKRTIEENLDSLHTTIVSEYKMKTDLYRSSYLSITQDSEFENKLFAFGYLPIDKEEKQKQESQYEIIERAIVDAKNEINSCVFIQDLIQKEKIYLEKNYQLYLSASEGEVDVATGVNLDDSSSEIYKEFASIEQDYVLRIKQAIQYYQGQYTLFAKIQNPDYVVPSVKECDTYIELYFDNEITNERTAQQGIRDLELGNIHAPTSYQSMIQVYYQLKMHKVKKSYLVKIRAAQTLYIQTGDATELTDLRSLESLDKEQIVNKYELMMQHYLSYNTSIINYKIPSLV
jgi:hypothetical protein